MEASNIAAIFDITLLNFKCRVTWVLIHTHAQNHTIAHTSIAQTHAQTHAHTHTHAHKHYTDMLCEIRTAHYFGKGVESGLCLKKHSDQTGVTIVGCSCQCSVSQLQRGGGKHVLLVVESKESKWSPDLQQAKKQWLRPITNPQCFPTVKLYEMGLRVDNGVWYSMTGLYF